MPTLLIPLRYVTIRHGSKVAYDLVLPALIGVALTLLLLGVPKPAPIFGKDAYLGQIQGPLTILGGFFVAALTLITTDKNAVLMEPIGGTSPPRLPGERAALSRKRFLAYLFDYLATSSFLLVGVALIAGLVAPAFSTLIHGNSTDAAKCLFLLAFNVWTAHVFVSTLLGLFYFTERLQAADRVMQVNAPKALPAEEI
jgi:hypothetical protein